MRKKALTVWDFIRMWFILKGPQSKVHWEMRLQVCWADIKHGKCVGALYAHLFNHGYYTGEKVGLTKTAFLKISKRCYFFVGNRRWNLYFSKGIYIWINSSLHLLQKKVAQGIENIRFLFFMKKYRCTPLVLFDFLSFLLITWKWDLVIPSIYLANLKRFWLIN